MDENRRVKAATKKENNKIIKNGRGNEWKTLDAGKSFEAVVSLVGTCTLLTVGNGPPDSPSSAAAASASAATDFKTPGKRSGTAAAANMRPKTPGGVDAASFKTPGGGAAAAAATPGTGLRAARDGPIIFRSCSIARLLMRR